MENPTLPIETKTKDNVNKETSEDKNDNQYDEIKWLTAC